MPAQDITIDGSASVVPAGAYYLYDAIDDLSLLAQIEVAMAAAGVPAPSAVLLANRKVRISGGAVFSINWTDVFLRDALGFTANLAGLGSYTASLLSPLLWSSGTPGKSMMTRKGLTGHPEYLTYQTVSVYSNRTESVSHGVKYSNQFRWGYVDADRIETAAGLSGEFRTWFAEVAVPSARFKIYQDVQEDPADPTPAEPLTTVLGPYHVAADRKGLGWTYDRSRGFEWTDESCDVDLNVYVPQEYDY